MCTISISYIRTTLWSESETYRSYIDFPHILQKTYHTYFLTKIVSTTFSFSSLWMGSIKFLLWILPGHSVSGAGGLRSPGRGGDHRSAPDLLERSGVRRAPWSLQTPGTCIQSIPPGLYGCHAVSRRHCCSATPCHSVGAVTRGAGLAAARLRRVTQGNSGLSWREVCLHCCLRHSGIKCKFSLLKTALIKLALVGFCFIFLFRSIFVEF